MSTLFTDIKYAIRQFKKSPAFTVIVVVTLALGIGANTAIFSAVDAVLLRPQPYPDPDRLVWSYERVEDGGLNSVSGASFRDWRDHQTQFEAVMICANDQFDMTKMGDPEKINALSVSSEFNRVLGLPPLLGRGILPEDDRVGGQNDVVLLTEGFWRARFGASSAAVGQQLVLDGTPREIIGVMPDAAWHQRQVSIFVPYVLVPNSFLTDHNVHRCRVLGRLKPAATLAAAEAELNAIKRRLADTYPAFKEHWGVTLRPMQSQLARESRPVLLLLSAAVMLVLLIACANVANLLLARASGRRREIALRAALGASRRRIVRQVFTESLLLALLGGCGGIALAMSSIRLLASLSIELLPATMTPQIDARLLLFSLLASCGTGVVFGLFPAWRVCRPHLTQDLKRGSQAVTDDRRARSQSMLVTVEVALTTVLLVGTGLLIRSMVQTVTADPGFKPDNVLMFDLTMPFSAEYQGQPRRMAFIDEMISAIEGIPGVAAVASAENLPFSGRGQGYSYSLPELPETRQDRSGAIEYVSPAYFEALGATLLRGRPIQARDNVADAPRVMVVNQALVDALFGEEDPLGRMLFVNGQTWEIVGVTANMRVKRLHTPPRATMYATHWHFPWTSAFIVRTEGEPLALASSISQAVHRLDPMLPLANLRTLEQALADSLDPQELILNLIALLAGLALVLACVGLFGVMAYTVAARHRELGIRLALGETPRGIRTLVFQDGGRLVSLGLFFGIVTAMGAARLLTSHLYGVSSRDPIVLAGTVVVLVAVSLFAIWLPARRAARIDPMEALRYE